MAESFKLPGSSYEEFVKIILAYSSGKPGQAMSLDVVAQYASMDKTIVSRNNGFLVQCGLISEGNQKAATEYCIKLGRAYQLKMSDEVRMLWRDLIENDEFLTRMLSAIRIRKTMEKTAFVNHIVYSSGSSAGKHARTGATTLVELFKVAGFVIEQDGQIIALEDIVPVTENVPLANEETITSVKTSKVIDTSSSPAYEVINININISVNVNEMDALSEKLKGLVHALKG